MTTAAELDVGSLASRGWSDGGWCGLHAYAAWEQLPALLEVAAPLAERAAAWFFVYYADAAGPHLRLRLRGEPSALGPMVGRVGGALTERGAHVVAQPYRRELGRYGGEVGIAAAERVFCASSAVARSVMDGGGALRARIGWAGLLAATAVRVAARGERDGAELAGLYAREMAAKLGGLEPPAQQRAAAAAAAAGWWRWSRHFERGTARGAPPAAQTYVRSLCAYRALLARTNPTGVARGLGSQLHMTCNRLRVSALDEVAVMQALANTPSRGS